MLTTGVGKRFQSSFKLIQHRLNFVSTCFNTVERGGGRGNGFNMTVHKIERMFKPFAWALGGGGVALNYQTVAMDPFKYPFNSTGLLFCQGCSI